MYWVMFGAISLVETAYTDTKKINKGPHPKHNISYQKSLVNVLVEILLTDTKKKRKKTYIRYVPRFTQNLKNTLRFTRNIFSTNTQLYT